LSIVSLHASGTESAQAQGAAESSQALTSTRRVN
jgi:hypothetical protein